MAVATNNHRSKSNSNSNSRSSHRPKQQQNQQKQTSSFTAKSTDATVFVKFTPASSHVTRQVLERWFGEIGPIRKCAVIRESQRKADAPKTNNKQPPNDSQPQNDDLINKGYGFVKFVSAVDAELAVQQLHGKTQPLAVSASGGHYSSNKSAETMQIRLVVDLATATPTTKNNNRDNIVNKNDKKANDAPKQRTLVKNPETPLVSPRNQQQPSLRPAHPKPSHPSPPPQNETAATTSAATDDNDLLLKKKRNRVIVRNLSFYAQEQHIRKELEERFGKIVDVHVPRVVESQDNQNRKKGVHRGFCFVTFDTTASAQQAVEAAAVGATADASNARSVLIHNRPVKIEWSVSKHVHEERSQQTKHERKVAEAKATDDHDDEEDHHDNDVTDEEEADDKSEQDEEDNDHNSEDSTDDNQDDSSEDHEDDDEGVRSSDEEDEDKKAHVEKKDSVFGDVSDQPDVAVAKHCCLFVRNLPFDATRHDLFEVFRSFGRISSIYLVKDRETGAPKGTAFVTFEEAAYAQRALEHSGDGNKPTGTTITTSTSGDKGLYMQGRRLVVHLAVDRDTASTLAMDKSTSLSTNNHALRGKDRRNLYLQTAGRVNRNDVELSTSKRRVDDGNSWDDLPESDQQKRQRAFADTSTKLKSPLFFINPNRISIRNIAKHVDETDLKRLCVEATKKGLERKLVSVEDQVAHWRALGELTPRDILQRLQENTSENPVIPGFNEKNVKQFIPSVFIDRDFDGAAKAAGKSRGFGFVEFQHHVHALACLRELNNNTFFTEEYVAGGKKAIMGARSQKKKQSKRKKTEGEVEAFKIPRLIVEFTVENKAKAKQQIAHRAQQQANYEKQKKQNEEPSEGYSEASKKPKLSKSRGAKQRARKRVQRDEVEPTFAAQTGNADANVSTSPQHRSEFVHEEEALVGSLDGKKVKGVNPPKKKRKVDKEEESFDKMVNSYRTTFAEVAETIEAQKGKEKRWFEEIV